MHSCALCVTTGGVYIESITINPAQVATAISSIDAQTADNAWRNLQGIRVAQPAHGLYIVNGKKVFVK
ncbi:MAG: hypothetical protein IJV45_00310 [Prevotella sp.]|nr:hypothetical protein [Prevotella sp.]